MDNMKMKEEIISLLEDRLLENSIEEKYNIEKQKTIKQSQNISQNEREEVAIRERQTVFNMGHSYNTETQTS